MLVGRIIKDQWDVSRFIVDMTQWFDTDETIKEVRYAEIEPGSSGWSLVPYPPDNAHWLYGLIEQYETTPLIFKTWTTDQTHTQLIVFLEFGTPSNAYTAKFTIEGTSLRAWTIEIGVQVTGRPPSLSNIALNRGFAL